MPAQSRHGFSGSPVAAAYPQMNIYIKSSLQHGKGVFARDAIADGDAIITFSGPFLRRSQIRVHDYHLQIGEDLYLGASGDADDYVNHSCEPNAGFHEGLVLVARRAIEPHEEITWDYSSAIDEQDYPGFECHCGSQTCRGTVHSFRHLNANVQKQLQPWLLPYLRTKYFPAA